MKKVLIITLIFLGGCASVKLEHVLVLKKAIHDERMAVSVRAGFEADVIAQRIAIDGVIAAMESASR